MVNRTIHLGKTPLTPVYVGPGDIVSSAYAWYGLRGYSAAYAAPGNNPAIDIVDSSGANAATINILNTGRLDEATLNAWIIAHGAAFAQKYYDQTLNGRHAVRSGAGSPQVLQNIFGTYSAFRIDSAVTVNPRGPALFTLVQPFTLSTVTIGPAIAGTYYYFGCSTTPNLYAGVRQGAGVYMASGGSGSERNNSVTINAKHASNVLYSGAASNLRVDGVASTAGGTIGTSGPTAEIIGVGEAPLLGGFEGYISEFGLWAGDNSASFATLETNQRGATYGWNF